MIMDDRDLVVELYHAQKQKRCLVVIDDIWQIDHWNILSAAFPIAEASCKVFLTTRNEKIAAEEYVYKLKFLTEDQGWELLQKIALPEDYVQVVPTELQELKKIGREVIHKCGCLPLAISVMGGILRDKQSLGEWKKVNENFHMHVQYGEGIEKETRVAQVLGLSYEVLPYYLKPCFLYLGFYAEDKEIDAEKLLLQWIAEGLITHDETQVREEILTDVAERYLSELSTRCLVQVKLNDEFQSMYRRFKSCRLHDLMRDLCLSKAKEEGFLERMNIYAESTNSLVVKTRRLALKLHRDIRDGDFDWLKNHANLRCLLLMNSEYKRQRYRLLFNLGKFSSLKILIIANCCLNNGILPKEIGNMLTQLKYLGIIDCELDEVPSSVGNLQRLQTLELRLRRYTRVPNVIHMMKRLRHLFLYRPPDSRPLLERIRLDGLNELETFDEFIDEYNNVTDIITLKNLRRFKAYIENMETLSVIVDYISSSSSSAKNLRETILTIVDCDLESEEGSVILRKLLVSPSLCRVIVDGQVGKLPGCEPHQLCPNLVDVRLVSSMIEDNPMEVLEKLPMLKKLQLEHKAFMGCKMICHASGFPQLRYLSLVLMPNLKEWIVEKGAAPKLSTLRISLCDELEMIPDGLRFISTLQKLEIILMPQQFSERLQKVDDQQGQDYDKVRHVSSIIFERIYNNSDSE